MGDADIRPVVRKRVQIYRKLTEADDEFIEKEIRAFRPMYIIAKELGCDRRTLSTYVKKNMPDVIKDMREAMLDVAEAKLLQNINSGNENAIEYFLDKQGRDRGYGEKLTVLPNAVPVINIGRIDVRKEEVIDVNEGD